MILSDKGIKQKIELGKLVIDPFAASQVQPASIDLRLGDHFLILDKYRTSHISLNEPATYMKMKEKSITIPPQTFLLATTVESIQLANNITAFVEGRSSIGRLGLFVQNAGWIDPGFCGTITLEAGRRICQLVIAELDQDASPYKGKYSGQWGATESRIYLEHDAEPCSNKQMNCSKLSIFD
ncbi:dCTP deaminase [Heyndrickxia ginsengihumi]|uniref:dCTP deaminase n=1 Tax=Heyndrickxia ginsengihumi TaxID=363870 RepID=UPI003D23DF82